RRHARGGRGVGGEPARREDRRRPRDRSRVLTWRPRSSSRPGFPRPSSPRPGMGNEFFRAAPRLRLVQLVTAGYDALDLEAARKAGVPVANCGGSNAVSVAEHTMTLMLAVLKRLVWQHNNVVAGKWRVGDFAQTRCYEVEGKVLGLVGLGHIGKKVARKANGLDMRVLYYDVRRLTEAEEDALGVRFVLFSELLAASDVVSLHVPLDETTRNLMSTRELGMMKPG